MKKLFACVLAAALAFTLAAPMAGALTFSDIDNHWAHADIMRMTDRGLFKGYEDGTYRPGNVLKTVEALALCARIAVPEATRTLIGTDRRAEMDTLLDGILTWGHDELATCLEVGIISYDEFAYICSSNLLDVPMRKVEFSRYLARAMGLGAVADGLENYSLGFVDAASVPSDLAPYVYVLNLYGIVNGTPENNFEPLTYVNRAVAATMLARALDEMNARGISIELPNYTDYDWQSGIITDVTAGVDGAVTLALGSTLSGQKSFSIPAAAIIYQNNMTAARTALKPGAFARVNFDAAGTVATVRLIPADKLSTWTGTVEGLYGDMIVMGSRPLIPDRFTEVRAGGQTGGWALIDPADYGTLGGLAAPGYREATVVFDPQFRALSVDLLGGQRIVDGILTGVETTPLGAVTAIVTAYDGSVTRYAIPADAPVSAGGVPATLSTVYLSRNLSLRVSNDDLSAVSSVEIDSTGRYLQGSIRSISTTTASGTTAQITEMPTGRQGTYQFAEEYTVFYNGKPAALSSVKNASYITAKLEGGQVVMLSAWPESTATEGKLSKITYGSPTKLDVTRADGSVVSFEIAIDALSGISIVRNGNSTDISQLRTGDSVAVTVQYQSISRIDATSQTADVSGTVNSITFNASGAVIDLLLADGSSITYSVASGISVSQSGAIVTLNTLQPGYVIDIVTADGKIVSIDIKQTVSSNTKLTGSIYLIDTRNRTVTLLVPDGAGSTMPLLVSIPGTVSIIDTVNGGTITMSRLAAGDNLEIWGNYNKQEFVATTVLRVN